MNYKKWIGIIVGVAILGAIGLELWTFSTMIWRGFEKSGSGSEQSRQSKENDPHNFRYNSIKGHFKVLYTRVKQPRWTFYCVLELTNHSSETNNFTVSDLRLGNGETLSLQQSVRLPPDETSTIQFNTNVPDGSTPTKMRIGSPESKNRQTKWIELPKVPVQSD